MCTFLLLHQLPPILPAPTPPLLGLGSFYISSPEPSPDELLDQKPLDLSSKSPPSESSFGWFHPDSIDAKNKESLLTKITSSLQKPDSPPVSGSRSPSDEGVRGGFPMGASSFLKQLSPSARRPQGLPGGLGSPGSLSTEDLIARVLEAKASGR